MRRTDRQAGPDGRVYVAAVPEQARAALEDADAVLAAYEQVTVVATSGAARAQLADLVDRLSPPVEPLAEGLLLQARRNAAERAAFLTEQGALTPEQVADLAGSSARNRHETASRLKRDGRAFSVGYRDGSLYPAFQFDADGRPRPVVARVLEVTDLDGWALALWFTTPSGWLGGAVPVALLDAEPDAVVDAARRDAAAHVF